jgi:hypothetical protein
MKIVRVVAESRDQDPSARGLRVYLLCGLDEDGSLSDGEWMGYTKQKNLIHAFVLESGVRLKYGGKEAYHEVTDLGSKRIAVGSYFIVEGAPEIDDSWATVFQVLSIHSYN